MRLCGIGQEGILGTGVKGPIAITGDMLMPATKASASTTIAKSTLLFDNRNPFRNGIRL